MKHDYWIIWWEYVWFCIFQSSSTIFHSHQQWTRVLFPHMLTIIWSCLCFGFGHSATCVVLSYFNFQSVMTKIVDHLFICLFTIWISSLVRCPKNSWGWLVAWFCFVFNWVTFCVLEVLSVFWITILNQISFVDIFLHFLACLTFLNIPYFFLSIFSFENIF